MNGPRGQAIYCCAVCVRSPAPCLLEVSPSGGCKANGQAVNGSGAGDVSLPRGSRINNPPKVVCYAVPQWGRWFRWTLVVF
jgi:hypothetical protein